MSDDIDPEVRADLQLRARTERERTSVTPVWTPPKIHSKVPCRGRCGSTCEWTEDAEERFQIFNRELERRNEAPLDKTKIVFCLACAAVGADAAAKRNRKMVDAVGDIIRELKAGTDAAHELDLLHKLEKAGHPNIEGLKQWLVENKTKNSAGGRLRRGSM